MDGLLHNVVMFEDALALFCEWKWVRLAEASADVSCVEFSECVMYDDVTGAMRDPNDDERKIRVSKLITSVTHHHHIIIMHTYTHDDSSCWLFVAAAAS